jgi:hypothetical protein
VIENAKRHKGMILLQKHQRKLLTKSQKVNLVGYEGENGRFWEIYSPCGSPVRTEFSRRPDSWASGNVRNGQYRPDKINYPSERWWQHTWVRTYNKTCPDYEALHMFGVPENTVRTTMLHPSGLQGIPSGRSTLKHQKNWEEFTEIKFSQVSVRIRIHNQLITQSERI